MTALEQKRKERRKETAEDFTPKELVSEMLVKLPQEVFLDPSKTFCDNSAGNGNFLYAVLEIKLAHGHDPLQALSTTYGVELMEDNVEEMKERLLELIPENLHTKAIPIIDHNIVCHDALTWDYNNWDEVYWEGSDEVIKNVSLRPTETQGLVGKYLALNFKNNNPNEPFEIYSFDITTKAVGRRN